MNINHIINGIIPNKLKPTIPKPSTEMIKLINMIHRSDNKLDDSMFIIKRRLDK